MTETPKRRNNENQKDDCEEWRNSKIADSHKGSSGGSSEGSNSAKSEGSKGGTPNEGIPEKTVGSSEGSNEETSNEGSPRLKSGPEPIGGRKSTAGTYPSIGS